MKIPKTNVVRYDLALKEYVAVTLAGTEVFGATRQACEKRLREANRVYAAHRRKNQGEIG